MDYSRPGSSAHGILQARILEWVVVFFSRGPSQLKDRIQISCLAGRFFTFWATREALTWRALDSNLTLLWLKVWNWQVYVVSWTFKILFLLCFIFKYKWKKDRFFLHIVFVPTCFYAHCFLFLPAYPTTLVSTLHDSSPRRQAHNFRFQVLLPSRHLSDSTPSSKMYVHGQISHTTKQASDTSWVSCSSTQFWHYLRGDSIRSHLWSLSPTTLLPPPTSDVSCKSSLSLVLLTDQLKWPPSF